MQHLERIQYQINQGTGYKRCTGFMRTPHVNFPSSFLRPHLKFSLSQQLPFQASKRCPNSSAGNMQGSTLLASPRELRGEIYKYGFRKGRYQLHIKDGILCGSTYGHPTCLCYSYADKPTQKHKPYRM
ncbi:hypothetical protein HBI80_023000 [Parastagonospora nodorum]|nr:hypothetical protein HBI01_017980 [Parastagonospora nodorum]KAH4534166.1 hypothetical protein HBH87_019480 [Parastagonospora nodorum]KAH4597166.1 hypothetical protein HBH83_017380 [Parastagonospora nodorum]KAH4699567.1 hypothetical protein HBH67_157660 [Parastagonospora nodorum]KAH4731872.1 hypothetical protein HBH66_027820 [Parastagonospora nodorum]